MHAFPLLVQWSASPPVYHGFLTVMDRELELCIEMPKTGLERRSTSTKDNSIFHSTAGPSSTAVVPQRALSSSKGSLAGNQELWQLLEGREAQLQQKMEEAASMEDFLIELVDTLESILSSADSKEQKENSVTYWSSIMAQIDALGWDRVSHLSPDLHLAEVDLSDGSQRRHKIVVEFPPGYPVVPFKLNPLEIPTCDSDQQWEGRGQIFSVAEGVNLTSAVKQAEKQLEIFRPFWDVMQDFDSNSWVIDPERPTKADCMRRCALGNHCSIQITVDPLLPRNIPETRLFGPVASVEPVRTKLFQNSGLWDITKLPRENLEVILELADGFPSPVNVSKEDMNIECGICYSFRYDGQVPDQLCSHAKCQQPFHKVCLYEWLRSVHTTRQSFQTLFGLCPYCSETITTTVPKNMV
ncbi:E3 ubiquitin-protein ligase FANCL [Entomortierella parvispora]|uniref:E3 ubiquitin-protein ligase FANCL n=1 Tax=Entomortierella parvispora TaxID=205924 RepID=A0A9P3HK43_9FUNG|nr:E3 ubiquitin-protein ligase FANCL [Entomortierella parvispora]